ncbi:MAG: DUF542 domain-containing protein, partial [Rhodospirillales bacterium]
MSVIESRPLAERTLGDIAAHLAGATAVLRAYKLDFCCGGEATLGAAAAANGLPVAAVAAALAALAPASEIDAPRAPAALIEHILSRYHAVHRHELPELIRLARTVEKVHARHPACPAGLADALEEVAAELESHMQREEIVLFPLMRQGGHPMIAHPIACMRHEHDAHGARLRHLETLTHGCVTPADGCAT